MTKEHLLKAFKLLESNEKKGYISGCKSEELIANAEDALNIKFPPFYRLFLKRYGCCGIGGTEIYGLTKNSRIGFDNGGTPDSIWLTLEDRKTGHIPSHFILIGEVGDGFYYYLDSSQPNPEGEYPVVIWGLGIPEKNKEKVAEDFGEFLLNQLTNALEDEGEDVAPPA